MTLLASGLTKAFLWIHIMASVHTILYRLKYVTVVVHTLVILAYLVHSCLLGELSIHKIHPIGVKVYIIM